MQPEKKVPKCSHCMFQFTNLFILLTGLTAVAGAILLNHQTKQWKEIEIGFMAYGGLLVVLAGVAQCVKNSTGLIRCYLFFMLVVFIVGLGISVAGAVKKDSLITIALNKLPEKDREKMHSLLDKHIQVAIYIVLGIMVIQFITLLISCCYYKGLKKADDKFQMQKYYYQQI